MHGIISAGILPADQIITINEAFPESAEECASSYGCTHGHPSDIDTCDIVVFGVKPQVFAEAIDMYGQHFTPDKLYLSIMAGVSIAKLEKALGTGRIIRFMPNLALSVGASATVYATGSGATQEDADTAEMIFSAMGIIRRVNENMISAVTALSGSGPAYFCLLTESMASAAVQAGIDPDTARELAVQTLVGTSEILKSTGMAPDELRVRVTSKKGTTEAALNAMADADFSGAVSAGFEAARIRSEELGRDS